jgi:hypothetical protein
MVAAAIAKAKPGLDEKGLAVLSLLVETWAADSRMSQRAIVRSAAWLGCHPLHEVGVVENEYESTTRMVRQVIRTLRLNGIPVLSDATGYYLPSSADEAVEYVRRTSATARARARASMFTYNCMKNALGISDDFLDSLGDGPNEPSQDVDGKEV